MSRTKQSVPSLSIYEKWLLDKLNYRCLEQICWSLGSSRYRELTVFFVVVFPSYKSNQIKLDSQFYRNEEVTIYKLIVIINNKLIVPFYLQKWREK